MSSWKDLLPTANCQLPNCKLKNPHLPHPPVFSGAASETPTAPPLPFSPLIARSPHRLFKRQRQRSRSSSGIRWTPPLLFGSTGFRWLRTL
ncbi:MAG: hypothetical protein IT258_06045 [Saprospiraceae bacterium]|nr:hypothetical protein [Saprospiraceae bacterium]